MDILGSLVGTGASALGGGLFGLAGNVASKVIGIYEAKQAFAQEQAKWVHDEKLLTMQVQAKHADTLNAIQLAQNQGSWSGLTAALGAESGVAGSYPWVNAVRALTRPALTLGLTLFLASAFFAMDPGDIDRAYVADSLVFAAVTAIVWWFGDRAQRKPGK